MDNSIDNDIIERNILTANEAIIILWEWRKYRNKVFWSSVYRYGAASVVITLLPYLLPDLIGKLGIAVLVFPIMAFLISIFGAYLMAAQYKLYKQVDKKYRLILGKYNPDELPNDRFLDRIFRISFGIIVVVPFLFFAVIGQIVNGLVLFYLVNRAII